ncbi:hypothetical protein EON64_06495 [archaeon]|nr:MAG: hypothetical protein EON64_06495 [archaeon]
MIGLELIPDPRSQIPDPRSQIPDPRSQIRRLSLLHHLSSTRIVRILIVAMRVNNEEKERVWPFPALITG